jgi:hypothetical protein
MLEDVYIWGRGMWASAYTHLGPNSPKKAPSLATIVAPSNFPHSQEFTSANIGKDIKAVIKIQFFITASFQFKSSRSLS